MEIKTQKPFEKPDAGVFAGTIIDVVNLPNVSSTYAGVTTVQNKIRVVWILGAMQPGQKILTSEGTPYQVIGTYNAKMVDKPKKSRLFELIEQILQGAPPLITNDEDLSRVLLGRANSLFLVKNANPNNPNDYFINVAGVSPLPPGVPVPQAPVGFVRAKDRVKTVAGPQGQPVQTYAQPQAPTGQPNANQQAAPAPTNNVSF